MTNISINNHLRPVFKVLKPGLQRKPIWHNRLRVITPVLLAPTHDVVPVLALVLYAPSVYVADPDSVGVDLGFLEGHVAGAHQALADVVEAMGYVICVLMCVFRSWISESLAIKFSFDHGQAVKLVKDGHGVFFRQTVLHRKASREVVVWGIPY